MNYTGIAATNISQYRRNATLASANTGSMNGLMPLLSRSDKPPHADWPEL